MSTDFIPYIIEMFVSVHIFGFGGFGDVGHIFLSH